MTGPGDPYSRVDYRKMVAWEARIQREGPFLRRLLESAPDRSVLDLGCGTGEHVAFFAAEGARAVGIDASPSMIEAAREHEAQGKGRFLLGDAREAPALLAEEPRFGLALLLGNVLPHLDTAAELDRLFGAARAVLRPGGRLLLQLLNYERILTEGIRHLPLNVRPGEDGKEIVFLRFLRPLADGRVLFFPTTLELDPEADEPFVVKATKRVELRAWKAPEVAAGLTRAGFAVRLLGGLDERSYDAGASLDLVVVATAPDGARG